MRSWRAEVFALGAGEGLGRNLRAHADVLRPVERAALSLFGGGSGTGLGAAAAAAAAFLQSMQLPLVCNYGCGHVCLSTCVHSFICCKLIAQEAALAAEATAMCFTPTLLGASRSVPRDWARIVAAVGALAGLPNFQTVVE